MPSEAYGEFTQEEVEELSSKEAVISIEKFCYFKPSLQDAVEIVGAEDVWQLKVNGQNLTGQGQTICIIDSGVDFSHGDLEGKNAHENPECQIECAEYDYDIC